MRKVFNKSGVSMILLSITMVAILGFAALVIDVGNTMYQKQKLANAIDAAALAGMANIDKSNAEITNIVKQYAQLNGADPDALNITIANDRRTLRVSSTKTVDYFFAKVLGFNQGNVDAEVGALIAPMSGTNGLRPLAIQQQELIYNTTYVLKEDAGDGYSGNYGALALGGTGASVYGENLKYGYNSTIHTGDTVRTQTGNISQTSRQGIQYLINQDPYATFDTVQQGSPRIIKILIVDSLDVTGSSDITVMGFAAFFVEGLQGNGGHTEITGRFIQYVGDGDCGDGQTDYGLKAIKLTN